MPTSKPNEFETVFTNEPDPYLAHILQLHAPMTIENPSIWEAPVKCLACDVAWPCKTFRIFKDRFTHITY